MTPRETDLILDRTLRGLGNADPSPGFANRLHARLAQPAPPSRSRRFLFTPSGQVFALCIAALLFTITALHPHRNPSRLPNSKLRTEQNLSTVSNSRITSEPNPSKLTRSTLKTQQDPLPQAAHTVRPASIPKPAAAPSADLDTQALNDLLTSSFPPPALPPTPQERLVALMLRRGEKHDLAQLDPATVDAFVQHERAAFREFFDPPPLHSETVTDPDKTQAVPGPTSASSTSTQPSSPGDPQ